ncbi:MAG TPA: RDD family protein [Aldersonia sp.]
MSLPAHRPAGIVSRGVAAAIDTGIVLGAMGGIYLGATFVRLLVAPQDFHFPHTSTLLSITMFLVLAIAYLTACWALSGRTVGAVAMGLRVVSRNGDLVGWPRALLRATACVMFAAGLGWCAIDRRRRSVQDILLHTAVVYDWAPDPELRHVHQR